MPRQSKTYRTILLSRQNGESRGIIFQRLEGGMVAAISGPLDRWGLVMPVRARTRRTWRPQS